MKKLSGCARLVDPPRAIASKLLSTMMTKIKQKLTTEGTENTEIYLFLRK